MKVLVRNSDSQIAMDFMAGERTSYVDPLECYSCDGVGYHNFGKFLERHDCKHCQGTGQEYRWESV